MQRHEFGERSFAVENVGASGHGDAPIFVHDVASPDVDQSFEANRHWLIAAETVAIVFAGIGISNIYAALGHNGHPRAFVAIGTAAALLYCGAMLTIEKSRPKRQPFGLLALAEATSAWLGAIGAATLFAYALGAEYALSSGAAPLAILVSGYAALLTARFAVPSRVDIYSRLNPRRARPIVIGAAGAPMLQSLARELRRAGWREAHLVSLPTSGRDSWRMQMPIAIDHICALARGEGHGELYIALPGLSQVQISEITTALRVVPHTVRIVPDSPAQQILHYPRCNAGRLYCVEIQTTPMGPLQRGIKRVMDLVLSGIALAILSPVLLLIALAIRVTSPGPALFRQTRLGYRGRPFMILKFRSMTVMEDGEEIRQAQKNDQRVTSVGRWLRRNSLDELPQLLNVLRGDMSLVGPRPHARAHDAAFAKLVAHYEVRQHVKPGITGWAQVNGLRGETASIELMHKRIEYDLHYTRTASIALDVLILMRTVIVVLRQRNAH